MKPIKLTHSDGSAIFVNPSSIVAVYLDRDQDGTGATVVEVSTGAQILVREQVTRVARWWGAALSGKE